MNLKWLTLFATIAEKRSFSRAATELNIAQPWLSAQMRKLEYEVGVQLLIRESTGVKVTEAGEKLLPYAQQVAEAAGMFHQVALTLGESRTKVVNLGSPLPLIDAPRLKSLIVEFARTHKNFDVDTKVDGMEELKQALKSGAVDLSILLAENDEDLANLDHIFLGETHVCLISQKRHAAKLDDLEGQMVGVPPSQWYPALHERLAKTLHEAGAVPREVSEFDRRAIERSVLVHESIAAIVIDEDDIRFIDSEVSVTRLDGFRLSQALCRAQNRDLGRATEHFWNWCAAADQSGD